MQGDDPYMNSKYIINVKSDKLIQTQTNLDIKLIIHWMTNSIL